MTTENKTVITVETIVNASTEKVWKYWSEPKHIMNWCSASDDWHAPHAENDLRVGGKFSTTMAAKDGSFSFDFNSVYTDVKEFKRIEYDLADGRNVEILFENNGNSTKVTESFEAENTHSIDMQQSGWQAILDNFKKYVENN
jgi:uncharacterized protein YndB with AHSA1/START domain